MAYLGCSGRFTRWLALCIAVACVAATGPPQLFFGPTANIGGPAPATPGDHPLAQLVDGLVATPADEAQWSALRAKLDASGGALHVRLMAISFMNATQLHALAAATTAAGGNLSLSVEGGGALCGKGSGTAAAAHDIALFQPFVAAGGVLTHWLLESIFSRTQRGCAEQSVAETAKELADFAKAIATAGLARPGSGGPALYLYDALPHYAVGDTWPANDPRYGLELGATLRALAAAMAAQGVSLAGYWMDCPFEYSRDYPNATQPLPAGSGFEKIAAAVKLVKGMGLRVGKTLNSQAGGQKSAQAFYASTMADAEQVAAVVPSAASGGDSFDALMVETWYSFPATAIPETTRYTTAYTALAVFNKYARLSLS